MSKVFLAGLERYFTPDQLARLSAVTVGIAGAGGLGSNCAMLLARSGIRRLILVDHDVIEPSNLNRQHYWPRQVGLPKVDALAAHLLSLNSGIELTRFRESLTPANLPEITALAGIWVEALDDAEAKRMFVEQALLADKDVVSASGICGFGGEPMRKRRLGRLTVVGDFKTSACAAPPLAPRVAQAAALLADNVLELVLGSGAQTP